MRRKAKREKEEGTGDGVTTVNRLTVEPSVLDLANQHMLARGQKDAEKPVFGTGNFKKKVHSESLAVHKDQIPEAIEYSKKIGVPVEYDSIGRPVFDNSAHFRRFLKARGWRHYGY
jgi:sugar/nucleoside kinase (ribokinase family)